MLVIEIKIITALVIEIKIMIIYISRAEQLIYVFAD